MSTKNSSLSTFVDAIEQIDAERAASLEERNAVLEQAEAAGYTKKILRAVVVRRRKERKDVLEADAALREFEAELGLEVLK